MSATKVDQEQKEKDDLVTFTISDQNDHIGILTLNAPDTYNALTVELGHAFSQTVQDLGHALLTQQQHYDLRAVIVTGHGTNAFSAGGNLTWLESLRHNSIQDNVDRMMAFYQSFLCIRQHVPVPVIAALNGPAMGAGGE